jgi:hypothetical protein
MQTFDIEKVEWQEISPDGTCYTLLEGDKQDPLGGFSYLLKLPAWRMGQTALAHRPGTSDGASGCADAGTRC